MYHLCMVNELEKKMKVEQTWVVYCIDADGSERKAGTVSAKSKGQAMAIVRQQGVKKVCDAVVKS